MNVKKLWKENKITILFVGIIILIILIFFLMIFPLYSTKSGSDYGNRLDGIKEVAINNETNEEVKSLFEDTEKVSKVKVNLKGKLYNITITVNDDVDVNEVANISNDVLSKFDEDQLKYYDFQIFITNNSEDNTKTVVGYKSKNSEGIVWTNNK